MLSILLIVEDCFFAQFEIQSQTCVCVREFCACSLVNSLSVNFTTDNYHILRSHASLTTTICSKHTQWFEVDFITLQNSYIKRTQKKVNKSVFCFHPFENELNLNFAIGTIFDRVGKAFEMERNTQASLIHRSNSIFILI